MVRFCVVLTASRTVLFALADDRFFQLGSSPPTICRTVAIHYGRFGILQLAALSLWPE